MWQRHARTLRHFHASVPRRKQDSFPDVNLSWEWLKTPAHPRMQRFLTLERRYLARQVATPHFRKVERALNIELRHRLVRQDASVPERIGPYEYYLRQARGENFPVYYRRRCTGDADEEIVLNQNVETSLDPRFHVVTSMKVAPDATLLLLVLENDLEQCQVVLKDLHLHTLQRLTNVRHVKNVEWSAAMPPHRVFYYTKVDATGRPWQVFRYNVATQAHERVFEEPNPAIFVDVSQTKDGHYILINCNSKTSSEIHVLESHDVHATPQLMRPREPNTLYFLEHVANRFYIVTNANHATNFQVATCTWSTRTTWHTVVPAHAQVKIDDVDVFAHYLVLYARVESIPRIRVYHLDDASRAFHDIALPKEYELCRIVPGTNRNVHAETVRFALSTPLCPEIVFDYDMKHQTLHQRKRTPVVDRRRRGASFQPHEYVCQRALVPSRTSLGVHIPLTLIHRRDVVRNGQNPTLLIGYGAYGTNLEAEFTLHHLSLLERGWIVALAHVRGGGECGLQWYHDGKGMQKRHSFDDYVSCTHDLLDKHYTTPTRLAGKGVSAGGLIMGFVANEYPHLYQALIMKVPFVDILATMQDATLPLTRHEYDEWGDPRQEQVYEYIKSYAPCENVVDKQVYPSMFVTGCLSDQRVQFWEPAKWMYKMRKVQATLAKRERRLLLLHMTQDGGHFGASGQLEQCDESAMEMAFLYQALHLPFSS